MRIYSRDMKHYKAQDGEEATYLTKTTVILIALICVIAYMSEKDYQECLAGNQSVVLCGGGNTK